MQDLAQREDSLVTTLKLFDNVSRKTDILPRLGYGLFWLVLFVATLGAGNNAHAAVQCDANKTITANVVVFDSPTIFNRLGAQNPNWIAYALERDVVDRATQTPCSETQCTAGNVELRPDKRPRPLVIRSIEGYCLTVNFTNLLTSVANPNNAIDDNPAPWQGTDAVLINNDQVAGRCAGFHATGTELVSSMADDGALVGSNDGNNVDAKGVVSVLANETDCGFANGSGLVAPNQSITYNLYTPHEGAFIINSYGATIGSEANSGNLAVGMFGALNVEPRGAKIYRSQMTEEEFRLATIDHTTEGQPVIDYAATYPNTPPWNLEGKAGLPIVSMLTPSNELVHSDINAIIAGPDPDGSWRSVCADQDDDLSNGHVADALCPYPLESVGKRNPAYPNRLEAFREFTSQYHDEQTNSQVFPNWYNDPVMRHVLHGVKDQFMINYGSGGIGSEIISNRLHAGPMHDCADCAYEEFFLASQTVGDPALLVNFPANTGIESCSPGNIIAGPNDPNPCWRDANLANGPIAGNFALYQEDPSNVHHAYTGDHVKMRNTHAGSFEQHIFHFHNHQWLFNPNDDNANYLDAQEIMPGSGHTYELVNGGAGNRNKTVGDAIFHCHFYPHFAQGMWYHMRNHDVYETGSLLAVSTPIDANNDGVPDAGDIDGDGFHDTPFALRSGKPAQGTRAYPDGELPDGSPIPAIVPLPGKPMPLIPAPVKVVAVDRGSHSLLAGRGGPDGIPDSSQAVVDHAIAAGADNTFGTKDDVSPGFPFWLAGNECGDVNFEATNGTVLHADCPMGIVGQRMPTPPLDMLTVDAAAAINPRKGPDGELGTPDDDMTATDWSLLGGGWDGGLPRHALLGYVSGSLSEDTNNRLDFRKVVHMAQPVFFPEDGTDMEKVSMAFQAVRNHPSKIVGLDGSVKDGFFQLNGAPAVPGGPYNDPCIDDLGKPLDDNYDQHAWWKGDQWHESSLDAGFAYGGVSPYDAENPRTYKVANLQIDAVFNKVGYHYAQERIIILWEDVMPTVLKQRPPEPLVMRFNTFDCGKILHANLVPAEFEVDDFQVRTPTDIIGQHIHLPKWDLTTNDGAANGWNYEDGTLSPGMVHERIIAINEFNHLAGQLVGPGCTLQAAVDGATDPLTGELLCPLPGQIAPIDLTDVAAVATLPNPCGETVADPLAPPADFTQNSCGTPGGLEKLNDKLDHYFGQFRDGEGGPNPQVGAGMYLSARTTIQRILVDPVFNVAGIDRGLGLTFSHDHYGPSTFQQIGLYSTILAEPAGSTWVHNETGLPLNDYSQREDGGPTSWQAAILTNGNPHVPDHREFYFEMSDFQHAYESGMGYAASNEFGIPGKYNGDGYIPVAGDPNPLDGIDARIATADKLRKTWKYAVNPTLKLTAGAGVAANAFPDTVNAHDFCPGPNGQADINVPRPCPEAINIGHASMWVVNYRNEPVGLRVFDPSAVGPDGRSGMQAAGEAGDLALAFQSRGDRAISELNTSFGNTPYPQAPYCNGKGDGINCDRGNGDPFTPIMRAYMNDHVKVKIQVGATEEQHQTTIHGMKWLSNGSGFGRSGNSGWRNFQSHGISEQFSLQVPITQDPDQPNTTVDYLYAQDATRDGIWGGTWGILRAYQNNQNDLFQLPNNPQRGGGFKFRNEGDFVGVCPSGVHPKNGRPTGTPANLRQYTVYAVLANDVLGNELGVTIPPNDNPVDNVGGPLDPNGGTLVYNRRGTVIPTVTLPGEGNEPGVTLNGGAGPLNDPTAMMYVLEEDLVAGYIPGESPDGTEGPDDATTGALFGPDYIDDRCQKFKSDGTYNVNLANAGCPVKLRQDDPLTAENEAAPVEPMVLRASAGDCIEVTLHNKLMAQAKSKPYGKPVFTGTGKAIFHDVRAQKALDNNEGLRDTDGNVINSLDQITFDIVPDLAGWEDTFWVVNRDLGKATRPDQMSFFGNNLIRPSARAGLVAQLVDYDSRQHQGIAVGRNTANTLAGPGEPATYRYYAGDLSAGNPRPNGTQTDVDYVATPIEFGGTNLLSADRVKQPQKGLFGALVIEPQGSTWAEDTVVPDGQGTGTATRPTRAQVTVTATENGYAGSGGTYRESVAVTHKIANLRWKNGDAIKNIHQAEFGVEGAEDSGHAGFNYGSEPAWFRFKLQPDAPFGNAMTPNSYGIIPNPQAMYSNALVAGEPNAIPAIAGVSEAGDPQTPVFRAQANMMDRGAAYNTRMYVLNGASADRDSTFVLHGHVWPRDPFVCLADSQDPDVPLEGRCDPNAPVPSQALGLNKQAKYMGGEEGMGHVFSHWPILFDAGGTGGVTGDYLFRDYTPSGNRNGMFGILRVMGTNPANATPPADPGTGGGGGGPGGGPGGGKGKK
jgi:hypothetical protein